MQQQPARARDLGIAVGTGDVGTTARCGPATSA